jgi:hypothetical protein
MTIDHGRAFALVLAWSAAACGGTVEPSAGTSSSATSAGSGGEGGAPPAGSGGGGACPGGEGGSGAGGQGPITCDGPGARFVTGVVSACFGAGETFGHDTFPASVLGPPAGGGCCMGSLDVISLGNGGSITLAFAGNAIVDGPGVDFLVFENVFDVGGDPAHPYAELATVEVSADGVTWSAFPCTAKAYPYGACAGWHPTFAGAESGIDPLDPSVAGGDPFDLADLGVKEARFVRITDRADMPGTFDLDAVAIVNALCP